MRKVAWRRWIAASAGSLVLVALAATSGLSAETTHPSPGNSRAWLGVYTQALTPELLEGMSYQGKGVLVNRVVPDGPADRAGVKKGDIITGFNARSDDDMDMEGGPHEMHIGGGDGDEPLDMELGPGATRWMGRGRLGVRVEGLNPD